MFNRQPFNQGKFNASSLQAIGNNGIALMNMGSNIIRVSKIISAKGVCDLQMKGASDITKIKYSSTISNVKSDSRANGTKVYVVSSDVSSMKMETLSNQYLSGESFILLENINLKPHDELIINTCDMTVTINGQNAMQYFSVDSDFFKLNNGVNEIIYSDDELDRNVSLDIIWKDRWL